MEHSANENTNTKTEQSLPDFMDQFIQEYEKSPHNTRNIISKFFGENSELQKQLDLVLYKDIINIVYKFIIETSSLDRSVNSSLLSDMKAMITKMFDSNSELREISSYNDIEKNVINIFNNVYNRDFNVNNEIDNLHTNIKKLQTENGEKLSNMHNNADNIKIEDKYSKIEV